MSHAKDQAALSKTTEQQDLVFRESDFLPLLGDDFWYHITFSSQRLEDSENLSQIMGLNCCAITGDVTI